MRAALLWKLLPFLFSVCKLQFHKYEASKAEHAWEKELSAKHPGPICPLITVPPFLNWIQLWITGSIATWSDLASNGALSSKGGFIATLERTAGILREPALEVFSIMWFKDECTGAEYIEPLVGTMRDPRSLCNGWNPPLHNTFPSRDMGVKDVSCDTGLYNSHLHYCLRLFPRFIAVSSC